MGGDCAKSAFGSDEYCVDVKVVDYFSGLNIWGSSCFGGIFRGIMQFSEI